MRSSHGVRISEVSSLTVKTGEWIWSETLEEGR